MPVKGLGNLRDDCLQDSVEGLSGAVLTETVFNLAGVGRTMYDAITGRDYVVIQGFTLIIAVTYVLVNLLVDVSYGFLDPRVRAR